MIAPRLFCCAALLGVPAAARRRGQAAEGVKDLADTVLSNRIMTKFAILLRASNLASFLSSRGALYFIRPDRFGLFPIDARQLRRASASPEPGSASAHRSLSCREWKNGDGQGHGAPQDAASRAREIRFPFASTIPARRSFPRPGSSTPTSVASTASSTKSTPCLCPRAFPWLRSLRRRHRRSTNVANPAPPTNDAARNGRHDKLEHLDERRNIDERAAAIIRRRALF